MSHPYQDQPARAFWKSAVSAAEVEAYAELYRPRHRITPKTPIATAGSCFAQHIGRALRLAGCQVQDAEPPPRGMSAATATRFGYGIYSARYGNLYTARQLRELLRDAADGNIDPELVWTTPAGRFVDPLRPTIEPDGLRARREVLLHRRTHLGRLAAMLARTEVFIFTLGLTEAWIDTASDRVLPLCPGVAAGSFDPGRHRFHNFTHGEVLDDLRGILAGLQRFNPDMRLILSVSPVPLVATATDAHVLSATTQSKAVLRAAAGEFVAAEPAADYMPAYEIVTSPAFGGPWFQPDLRSVRPEGVERVMGCFLAAHDLLDGAPPADAPAAPDDLVEADDILCDELLLQAFAK